MTPAARRRAALDRGFPITDGKVVRRILDHLGLPTAAPVLAPARSPPELEFAG